MPGDIFSNYLGALLQGTGNNNNNWGNLLNGSDIMVLESAIAGSATHAVTGGTLDLSTVTPPAGISSALEMFHVFTGVLTAAQIVIVPNISRIQFFRNLTSGAFPLTVKTPGGLATQIPPSSGRLVIAVSGVGCFRTESDEIGSFIYHTLTPAGTLLCDGSSVLRTDYPDLFTKIGTTYGAADGTHFNLPNLTDTGRYLRSSGPGTVGTYQSNQNASHSHTVTGAPGLGTLATDSQGAHTHTATVNDPQHTHPINDIGAFGGGIVAYLGGGTRNPGGGAQDTLKISQLVAIGNAATNITVTNASNGAHVHNVTGAPGLGTLATATSGGAETRPESLVVKINIKF